MIEGSEVIHADTDFIRKAVQRGNYAAAAARFFRRESQLCLWECIVLSERISVGFSKDECMRINAHYVNIKRNLGLI